MWQEFDAMRSINAGIGIPVLTIESKSRLGLLDNGASMAISSVIVLRNKHLRAVGFSEKLTTLVSDHGPDTKWLDGDPGILDEFMVQHQELSNRVDCSWNCVASRFEVPHRAGNMQWSVMWNTALQ